MTTPVHGRRTFWRVALAVMGLVVASTGAVATADSADAAINCRSWQVSIWGATSTCDSLLPGSRQRVVVECDVGAGLVSTRYGPWVSARQESHATCSWAQGLRVHYVQLDE